MTDKGLLHAIERGLAECRVYDDDIQWMASVILRHVEEVVGLLRDEIAEPYFSCTLSWRSSVKRHARRD